MQNTSKLLPLRPAKVDLFDYLCNYILVLLKELTSSEAPLQADKDETCDAKFWLCKSHLGSEISTKGPVMAWYWVVLIVLWGAGAPWGIVFAFKNPDVFYHHTVLDGFDIIVALFMYLLVLSFLMALG